MPPTQFMPSAPSPTGRYLSFGEREEIALGRARGLGVNAIARSLGRSSSTISRELRRNAATRSGGLEYRATPAQWHADRAAKRPKPSKIAQNARLQSYIEERLAGRVIGPNGKALRMPRARRTDKGKAFAADKIMIRDRPPEAEDRAVPGHWEGGLILGLKSTSIGTLVERTTRYTMLLHLPPAPDKHIIYGKRQRTPVAGHGAEAVRKAICASIAQMPESLRKSLTWDQGAEMAQHDKIKADLGLQVYFCNPQSPWQRGTNENTNGLLRQYFPKGTDLGRHSKEELEAVAFTLNNRPRKTLGWKTPAEAMEILLK